MPQHSLLRSKIPGRILNTCHPQVLAAFACNPHSTGIIHQGDLELSVPKSRGHSSIPHPTGLLSHLLTTSSEVERTVSRLPKRATFKSPAPVNTEKLSCPSADLKIGKGLWTVGVDSMEPQESLQLEEEGERGWRWGKRCDDTSRVTESPVLAPYGRWGHKPRPVSSLCRWNRPGSLPWSPQKGMQPAHTLVSAQGDPCQTCNPQNSKMINLCCFKPLRLW